MNKFLHFCSVLAVVLSAVHARATSSGKYFDRAIFVIFENTDYATAIRQPFFKRLADQGASFSNFTALTHPSQGNYIGLTSGDLHGVAGDGKYDLDNASVVDLLEAKGLTWKVYAEDYPGGCFVGMYNKDYVRKHNPFISYLNIQSSPARCANIVEASEFDTDATQGTLPNYVFYIPNIKNDGHDTGVAFADKWYAQKFQGYLSDGRFMKDTVLISTFDESAGGSENQIYTTIVGPAVRPGVVSAGLNTYSLLSLVEENWNLGNLGQKDASAAPIPNIWL